LKPFRILRPAFLAAFLALAGCAVGPNYTTPAESLPSTWTNLAAASASSRSDDLARWWERFEDPLLTQLVDEAQRANLDVRSAQARLREARAQRDLAQAQLAPSVGYSSSASGGQINNASAQQYNLLVDASWEIDVFGGQRRAVEAADADLQASVANVDAARVSLTAEVARNYVELRGYQARLEIAQSNLALQDETVQLTEWRAQAGLVGELDVEQARSNRAQTRAQIPAFRTGAVVAENALAVLLAVAPGALHQRLATVKAIPRPPQGIAVGIPADVLRQRPDVHIAERTLAAETARIGQAEAAHYPSFNLQGSIGLEAISLHVLTSGASLASSLLASVAGPLFDAGRIDQQVNAQTAVRDRAQLGYEAVVLTALKEIENALVALGNSQERQAQLNEAVEAARSAEFLARTRYSGGLIDFQTVLDTQRSLRTLEDSLAGSEADRALALVQLYKALGGGWSPSPTQATSG
jgi:NodT family efflux transporter outer membrane factor (OMF) lipoprotein